MTDRYSVSDNIPDRFTHNALFRCARRRIALRRTRPAASLIVTLLAAVGIACPSAVFAQSVLATARGLVTDSSGGVLPGVAIVITEPATELTVRSVTTDGKGNYEIADVKPGRYRLTATLDGFAPYVADDLLLESGQTRRVDINLNVGGTTDQVTVVAGAQVITTDTGTISGRFDKTQFADNPTVDTYPSNLSMLTTQPGIQGGNGGWTVRISGQGPSQQSWGMDGIENDRTGDQTNNMNWFEEATVTTVNATADSARIVNWNMTSKRGNNELRGMAYYKHFDSALNARPFFEDEEVDSQTREWQGELGGPVLSGRTFFYGTWMQQNIPTGSFQQATVPTLTMRQGEFSQFDEPLIDPQTGRPFAGNRIPADRLSPLSLQAQERYYPRPNQGRPDALTDNYNWTHSFPNSGFKFRWPFVRLDHNLSSKNSVYFRWLQRKSWHANSGSLPAFTSTRIRNHQQFTVSDTHVFSPTLVNTLRVGLSTNHIEEGMPIDEASPLDGADAVAALGLQGVNRLGLSGAGFPEMDIDGLSSLSVRPGGLRSDDRDYSLEESITWQAGQHVIKAGGEWRTFETFEGEVPDYGSFTFNGVYTGNAYADFLLGLPFESSRQDPLVNRTRTAGEVGLFVMDTFKVGPRLTLDYGVRWDYFHSPEFEDGLMFNWDAATGAIVVPPDARDRLRPIYPANIPVVTGDVVPESDRGNVRPRLAFAYRVADDLVVRGGYGAFTERIDYFERVQGGGPFEIAEIYENVVSPGRPPLFAFPNPFPGGLDSASVPSQSVTGYPMETDNGTIHQFNLSVEKEIAGMGLRASYIGSRGRGLNYSLNINKPEPSTTPFDATRRPYPELVNTTVFRSDGSSNYDALQIQAQRRAGPLTFNAHWTLSSSRNNFSNRENPYDVLRHWSRESDVRRHHAVITSAWRLPSLSDRGPLIRRLAGDWTLATVSYLASGRYFSPSFSGSDPSNTNTVGGLPDRVGEGNLPSDERTPDRWFDPNAFAVPEPGRYGNSGVNVLEGQGLNVHHLSLAKKVRLSSGMTLTYTVAVSNLFNHPHFLSPRDDISTPGTGEMFETVEVHAPEKSSHRTIAMKLRFEF